MEVADLTIYHYRYVTEGDKYYDDQKGEVTYPSGENIYVIDENGEVDETFEGTFRSSNGEVEFTEGHAVIEVAQNEKIVIYDLPADKTYRFPVQLIGSTAHKKYYSTISNDLKTAKNEDLYLTLDPDGDNRVYSFLTFPREARVSFTLRDGTEYGVSFRDPDKTKGDLRKLIVILNEKKTDLEKQWDGKEVTDKVELRLRWRLNVEEYVKVLHKAITVKGVDEETIIEVLSMYMQIPSTERGPLMQELLDEYEKQYGRYLDEILRKALVGHLEAYVLAIVHNVDIYPIEAKVRVDDEGYCFVDATLEKASDWKTTIEGVNVPHAVEVIELTQIKNCKMTYKVNENTQTRVQQEYIYGFEADPDGEEYNEETGEWGWRVITDIEERVIADPLANTEKVTVTNKITEKKTPNTKATTKEKQKAKVPPPKKPPKTDDVGKPYVAFLLLILTMLLMVYRAAMARRQ